MLRRTRKWLLGSVLALLSLFLLAEFIDPNTRSAHSPRLSTPRHSQIDRITRPGFFKPKFRWKDVPEKYPVTTYAPLPTGRPVRIPQIQHDFERESPRQQAVRSSRQVAVKQAFEHTWKGYKKYAWMHDEVAPITGQAKNPFGGWGATLIDSLDTLWIMGMKSEFTRAVAHLKNVDFVGSVDDHLNVFETTIRYLGGLLSAYDLSGHEYPMLLQKAVELGEMLYKAFDTPNRMPITRWDWQKKLLEGERQASRTSIVAEVGSFTLEFTRLSQLTGDPKWYDAAARIMEIFEKDQSRTKIPGLWPTMVDTASADFTRGTDFTIGALADSLYEYLPKQHLMTGGHTQQYESMFGAAMDAVRTYILFHASNPDNRNLLIPGSVKRYSSTNIRLQNQGQHLSCYAGGMVGLGAKIFNRPEDLAIARQLVDGCIWAYESMPTGIMPESFTAMACSSGDLASSHDLPSCAWDEKTWLEAVAPSKVSIDDDRNVSDVARKLIADREIPPHGFLAINDPGYSLRPEAIESVFVLYRITGDPLLQDAAWRMFQSIKNTARTDIAFAAVSDVTTQSPVLLDSMESFWTAETLKYFYLVFSEPELVSLDEYVLNTEAHPLLRPKQ